MPAPRVNNSPAKQAYPICTYVGYMYAEKTSYGVYVVLVQRLNGGRDLWSSSVCTYVGGRCGVLYVVHRDSP